MPTTRKTALVTGGTRGIGRAIAEELAADHDVLALWHSTPPEGLPANVQTLRADLSQPQACAGIVETARARLSRLDVIVNNAGVIAHTPKERFDSAAAQALFDVNLFAPAALLAAALPHLEPGAAIVSVSSVNAVLPPRDAALYGASKAALDLWTRAMAKELGPSGIRVNAVAPGAIETPEAPRPADLTARFVQDTALGRIGTPRDVARAVRFLAGEAAGFITGEVLTVSGGYRL